MVYATGRDTFFGRAAALVGGAKQQANLQKVWACLGSGSRAWGLRMS